MTEGFLAHKLTCSSKGRADIPPRLYCVVPAQMDRSMPDEQPDPFGPDANVITNPN